MTPSFQTALPSHTDPASAVVHPPTAAGFAGGNGSPSAKIELSATGVADVLATGGASDCLTAFCPSVWAKESVAAFRINALTRIAFRILMAERFYSKLLFYHTLDYLDDLQVPG